MSARENANNIVEKIQEHARLSRELAYVLDIYELSIESLKLENAKFKEENALLKGENAALRKRVLVVEANVDHWLDLPIEQHPGSCECPDCYDVRIQY